MVKLSLALAITLAAAGAALAETPMTATLNNPVPSPKEVLAGSTLWACVDKTCVVKTPSTETPSWLECRKLVLAVGPLSAYLGLDETKLMMCNTGGKK